MDEKQFNYFTKAYVVGERIPFNIFRCEHLDQGIFGTMKAMTIFHVGWRSDNGTAMAFHTACAHILRHILGCTEKTDAAVTTLVEVEKVLGRPTAEPDEGRLPHVRYEEASPENVRVQGYKFLDDDFMRLDWVRFKADGFAWTYAKPDTFPRFHRAVKPSRFPKGEAIPPSDLLVDVVRVLLPYLSDKSFVTLLGTCRSFRRHALTTFQAAARQRVLALDWAVPLLREYTNAPQATRDAGVMLDPEHIPSAEEGDWHLYLCHVHRSQSMRARHWIWATAQEIRRAYLERRAGGPFDDIVVGEGADRRIEPSAARQSLEQSIRGNPTRILVEPDW
ncbi:hypothetical protein EIP86_007795 [Pleurotus ostreatoroseus]|nr:hypothetical protein EIP86_007795 [Pleurotus ostreatoroseus]